MERLFAELSDELERELKGNILPWWMAHTVDLEHGGFLGHVDHFNRPAEGAGKGAVLHARILWTFAAAFRRYGEHAYLELADRAFRYILDRFMDPEHGGVYWEVDGRGMVSAPRKQIYALAFVIYAMAEYHMACGDQEALQTATRLFREIESRALDRERNGYVEAFSRDWSPVEDLRLSEKDDNASKTMNTHLHIMEAYGNLLRTWKDEALERALENVIGLFLDHFAEPGSRHLNLFFDDRWNLRSSLVSFGHDIECSWLLHEAAGISGNRSLLERTGPLAVEMALASLKGLDGDGGLFYEWFPEEGRFDTDKHWWPQAEAMVGFFNAYQLSGNREFARRTLESWTFIKGKIIDRRHGEWYWSVNREGVPQTRHEKAGFWKCPYHNGRACMELIRRIALMNQRSAS